MSVEKVIDCIRKNKRFIITTHINVEGDALGSELALAVLLKRKGKEAVILNQDKVPPEYRFLPGVDAIKNKLGNFNFEVAVILDCSDLNRCGKIQKLFANAVTTLNIDHHISNSKFADINWVKPRVSSAAEMVYELYQRLGVPFKRDSAVALYAGILTDTGSFRYANTNYHTHMMAASLLKAGAVPQKVYQNIYQSNSFEDMKFLAKILPSIRRDREGKLVWFVIPGSALKKASHDFDLTEHVLSFGRKIKGVEVVVVFKENLGKKNQIKVNFRSQGECDVNRIAKYFGGGGHRSASACTVTGSLREVSDRVLAKIREILY